MINFYNGKADKTKLPVLNKLGICFYNIMDRLCDIECKLNEISSAALAFVGDSVFDLLVREYLVCNFRNNIGILNKMKTDKVCCTTQADDFKKISEFLTEEELSVYKRGRNLHTSHVPKNSSVSKYHCATGFECIFGYVYLSGDIKRLRKIFELVMEGSDDKFC